MKASQKLLETVGNSPIVQYENYAFRQYPFGERGEFMNSDMVNEISLYFKHLCEQHKDFDAVVSTEPGGHLWGLMFSYVSNKNFNIIRVKDDKHSNESDIHTQQTGYISRKLVFSNLDKMKKVVIVEDVISSGATIKLMSRVLANNNISISAIVSVLRKNTDDLGEFLPGIPIYSLLEDPT